MNIKIPEWEIEFRADRASGPGGQNVNKTATKVTVRFKVDDSKTLDSNQKEIVKRKLSGHINKDGEVVLTEQSSRSQWVNRQTALAKLNDILTETLIPEKERRKTKIPKREKEYRLTEKKIRGEIKKARSKIDLD